MYRNQRWSSNIVNLCCVLSFLSLPTNIISASNIANHIDTNTHKNTEYASQKLNHLLDNQKRRVRRQLQTALQLQLTQALQQNPQLLSQLQQNPELLANLRKKLTDVYSQHHTLHQQQESHKNHLGE